MREHHVELFGEAMFQLTERALDAEDEKAREATK